MDHSYVVVLREREREKERDLLLYTLKKSKQEITVDIMHDFLFAVFKGCITEMFYTPLIKANRKSQLILCLISCLLSKKLYTDSAGVQIQSDRERSAAAGPHCTAGSF